jgi:hypothetical protein
MDMIINMVMHLIDMVRDMVVYRMVIIRNTRGSVPDGCDEYGCEPDGYGWKYGCVPDGYCNKNVCTPDRYVYIYGCVPDGYCYKNVCAPDRYV